MLQLPLFLIIWEELEVSITTETVNWTDANFETLPSVHGSGWIIGRIVGQQ